MDAFRGVLAHSLRRLLPLQPSTAFSNSEFLPLPYLPSIPSPDPINPFRRKPRSLFFLLFLLLRSVIRDDKQPLLPLPLLSFAPRTLHSASLHACCIDLITAAS